MVSPDNKIDPTRDVTVRSKELAEKQRKLPLRSFDDVVEQVDERRQRDEEGSADSKSEKKKRPAAASKKMEEEDKPLSLFDLVRRQRPSKDKGNQEQQETPQEETKEIAAPETTKKLPQPVEQHDLSFIPPPLEITQEAPLVKPVETVPHQTQQVRLQEIIDQIVKQVYTLKGSEGVTETVVELEGRFKGARLIVKEFDFAKKEMNITIDRLPTASDQQYLNAHRLELVDKLAREHQIVVHIFTATTASEQLAFDYKPGQSPQEREHNQGEGSQRQKNPYEETEEEQT